MTKYKQQSIGIEKAIHLADTEWWKDKSAREIVKFQLFTQELCMPFAEFHRAIEEALGRSVFKHEFGMNLDGIIQEFLGERDAPTMQEIIELIPEGKRIVIEVE
jgi:hypothetical protein